MSLFEKIDYYINRFLYWIIDLFKKGVKKLFPISFIQSVKEKCKPLTNRYEIIRYKFDQQVKWASLKIEKSKDLKTNFKTAEKVAQVKKFFNKIFSSWYIDKLKRLTNEKAIYIKEAIGKRFESFNEYHLLALTIVLVIAGFAFLNIYTSTFNIVDKEYTHKDRKIASVGFQQKESFPYYLDYEKKLSMISQLVMPAFMEDTGRYENLKINFAIQFTNRTSKRFFDKYRYLFMDQLQVTLEPVLPSFPLTEEGKDIVRKKLFEELNDVLMNEGIDGRVKSVTIIDIIAN